MGLQLFVVTPVIMERCRSLEPADLLGLPCQSLLRACGLLCERSRAWARDTVTKRAIFWLWEPKHTPGEESGRETQYSSDPISGLHRSGLVGALCSHAGLSFYKESPQLEWAGARGPSVVDTIFGARRASGGLISTREVNPTWRIVRSKNCPFGLAVSEQ